MFNLMFYELYVSVEVSLYLCGMMCKELLSTLSCSSTPMLITDPPNQQP